MKYVRVVAAVICDSIKDKRQVFAAARGYGEFKGWWEFPDGKIEDGETSHHALVREIKEELRVTVHVGDLIGVIEHNYPTFRLVMECFWCEIVEGELTLVEAEKAKWLTKTTLYSVNWLQADRKLIEKIRCQMND